MEIVTIGESPLAKIVGLVVFASIFAYAIYRHRDPWRIGLFLLLFAAMSFSLWGTLELLAKYYVMPIALGHAEFATFYSSAALGSSAFGALSFAAIRQALAEEAPAVEPAIERVPVAIPLRRPRVR